MFKHFFWDFDGTLFDTYPAIGRACVTALSRYGVALSLQEAMHDTQISWGFAIEKYQTRYGLDQALSALIHSLRREFEPEMAAPFPGAQQALQGIVLQGGKNYLYTHRDLSAMEFLKRFKLDIYFQDAVTSEDGFARKPNPDALFHLLSKHHIEPKHAVMIGDREIDLLSGKNAGMASCWFGLLSPCPDCADFSIASLQDILLFTE